MLGIRHTDHFDPVRFEQGMKIEITRVVYQHHIARLQEKAANQIDGLRARFGQHNLLGRHFQARAVQASGNQAA